MARVKLLTAALASHLQALSRATMPAMNPIDSITFTRPDDWHLHLRDGAALTAVVPHTAHQFARAIVMPNLKPPVTTAAQAMAYRERILAAVPAGAAIEP